MKREEILNELRKATFLEVQCPKCRNKFRISSAEIFDVDGDMPPNAKMFQERKESELKDRRSSVGEREAALKDRKLSAMVGSEEQAERAGFGMVLEKLIPGRDDFPHNPQDCRALYEPIDYLAFNGLTQEGSFKSITFLEMKTGNGKLSKHQNLILKAIKDGMVDYKEI